MNKTIDKDLVNQTFKIKYVSYTVGNQFEILDYYLLYISNLTGL